MQNLIKTELKRLEKLSEMQLMKVLDKIENDQAPEWCKTLIRNKIRECMNSKLGLATR